MAQKLVLSRKYVTRTVNYRNVGNRLDKIQNLKKVITNLFRYEELP